MSLVKQALAEELKERALKAVQLKAKIDSSKTEAKRSLYEKKLRKNNIEAVDILMALDKIVKHEESKKAAGEEDEAHDGQGRTETSGGTSTSME